MTPKETWLRVADPKGEAYSFLYDLLNRKTRMTYPGGDFEQYGYDSVGNIGTFSIAAARSGPIPMIAGTAKSYQTGAMQRPV
jgi:hypothetical protein